MNQVELKVGDKVIYTHDTALGKSIYVRTVKKVNKSTYKLNTDDLITKDLKPRTKRSPYSSVTETYEPYTDKRWAEIKKAGADMRYKKWINKLERNGDLDIDHMKRYIKEQECDK